MFERERERWREGKGQTTRSIKLVKQGSQLTASKDHVYVRNNSGKSKTEREKEGLNERVITRRKTNLIRR